MHVSPGHECMQEKSGDAWSPGDREEQLHVCRKRTLMHVSPGDKEEQLHACRRREVMHVSPGDKKSSCMQEESSNACITWGQEEQLHACRKGTLRGKMGCGLKKENTRARGGPGPEAATVSYLQAGVAREVESRGPMAEPESRVRSLRGRVPGLGLFPWWFPHR